MQIEVKDLEKRFNKDTVALQNINLSMGTGIWGLLGKNGSGKTTLMRILTSLMEPTKGTVKILGVESNTKNQVEIKKNIGYLPQEFGCYNNFTILEIMDYMAILSNIDKHLRKSRIDELLKNVGLRNHMHKKYNELSGGMKRRLGLAQAIIRNPPILIVDEPTVGVDPEERINIRKLLSEYSQNNLVLFSTHIVEDIESTCNKIIILNEGKIIFNGDTSTLLKKASGIIWECSFSNIEEFRAFELNHKIISFKNEENRIVAKAIASEQPIESSILSKVSLEDAYIYSLQM